MGELHAKARELAGGEGPLADAIEAVLVENERLRAALGPERSRLVSDYAAAEQRAHELNLRALRLAQDLEVASRAATDLLDTSERLLAQRDALAADVESLTRRIETTPPWPDHGEPLDEEQLRALRLRWSTGPERYQADADALIATTMLARADAERLRAELDRLRTDAPRWHREHHADGRWTDRQIVGEPVPGRAVEADGDVTEWPRIPSASEEHVVLEEEDGDPA